MVSLTAPEVLCVLRAVGWHGRSSIWELNSLWPRWAAASAVFTQPERSDFSQSLATSLCTQCILKQATCSSCFIQNYSSQAIEQQPQHLALAQDSSDPPKSSHLILLPTSTAAQSACARPRHARMDHAAELVADIYVELAGALSSLLTVSFFKKSGGDSIAFYLFSYC